MARINIFLSDEQLQAFDRQAKAEGISRSALIQKAMEVYLEKVRHEKEEAQRRGQMEQACKKMDELAEKAGYWDPVKIIRFYRDTRYGPDWWKTRTNPEYRPKARKRARV
jgi:hypothetical protein